MRHLDPAGEGPAVGEDWIMNGGTKWKLYNGTSHSNGFGVPPILENPPNMGEAKRTLLLCSWTLPKNFDKFPGEVSCCHKMENLPIIRTF